MANPIELPLVDISNSHDVAAGKKLLDAAVKHGFLYADSNSTMLTALDVDQTFNLVREYPLRLVPREAISKSQFSYSMRQEII
ncbi:hypothetical protein PENANT_c052G01835 [Penicillium antarcticum]|uniref:Non-haem dioxygenase N-terminal domain-containing protein n=1 Tax=Penicillium antarcticum TaxID=416450 RepID=A0A1V6PQY7_9EURO|nr:hypothetical protein PENANT_c052G01835 [Penicillium antarcticum]